MKSIKDSSPLVTRCRPNGT